jgi:hypothetical protein
VQVPVLSFKFASALAILACTLTILGLLSWCGGELSLQVRGLLTPQGWQNMGAGKYCTKPAA